MTITTDTTLLHDPRRQAALLYWQGFSVPQIAAMLQMKRPTVQSWKQRDGWDSVAPISRVEMSLEARLTQLIIKPQKTGGDFKEIDLLGRQIERLARVNRYSQTGNEADLNADYPRFRRTMKAIKPDLPMGQATHALRHSFATHFMINGGSIITLQRILGHTRIEQTMVYAHFAPEYLQDAISLNPLRGGTEAESVHTVSTVE